MMAMLAAVDRVEECRAFGARALDPEVDARMEAMREKSKAEAKQRRIDERTPEERARAQMPSLNPQTIREGAVYLGRKSEDWPRRVTAIEDVDQPRAPSGKVRVVRYVKVGGETERTLTLTNFAHWAVEEAIGR